MLLEKNALVEQQINDLHIQVAGGGYVYADKNWQAKDVCSPCSKLFFITQGCGIIEIGGRETRLLPGRVYLIPINVRHAYRCEHQMQKLWFHINMELYDGVDLFSGLEGIYDLPFVPEEISQATAHYRGGQASGVLALSGLLYGTLSRFASLCGVNERPLIEYSPLLKALFPVVRASISSRMTARGLAERLAVSESTLTKRFRAETGQTLGKYLDGLLMHRARQLLLSGKSIGEIADQLEFCDQFYFSRYFSQRQGDTPSAYRRRMKNQL